MRKLFLSVVIALTCVACGNKKASNVPAEEVKTADSTIVENIDSTGIKIQEEVENQLQTVFAKLKEMNASDEGINTSTLEKMFCSEGFLRQMQEVKDVCKNPRSSEDIFTDEGWHWFPGIGVAETVDSIMVETMQENKAEAKIRLTDKQGNKARQHLVLVKENGQWKIDNWIDPEAYYEGSYIDQAKAFLELKTGKKPNAAE